MPNGQLLRYVYDSESDAIRGAVRDSKKSWPELKSRGWKIIERVAHDTKVSSQREKSKKRRKKGNGA